MGFLAKFNQSSTPSSKAEARPQLQTKSTYRGVQVITGKNECCQAVQEIADQRFLSEQTPMLPLRNCDAAMCRCAYERFDDRRTDLRRASDVGYDMASLLCDQDNRANLSAGRREDD